jgi:hypothetical protein
MQPLHHGNMSLKNNQKIYVLGISQAPQILGSFDQGQRRQSQGQRTQQNALFKKCQVSEGGANKTILVVFGVLSWRKMICSMVSTSFHWLGQETNKEDWHHCCIDNDSPGFYYDFSD